MMAASRYGVVIGKVIETHAERSGESPHYELKIDAGESGIYEVPINVRSIDPKHHDLLYFLDPKYDARAITILPTMKAGFHDIRYAQNQNKDIAVDFIRSGLFNPNQMKVIPADLTGPDNDLNDKIDQQMKLALNNPDATIYVFGTHYSDGGKGVHNVHMNQGNTKFSASENGTYHDGCFLLHFEKENRWLAYFLAFQSQSWCTNDDGKPLNGSVDHDGNPLPDCTYDSVKVSVQTELLAPLHA
jgi:uncharacterized protein YukJ